MFCVCVDKLFLHTHSSCQVVSCHHGGFDDSQLVNMDFKEEEVQMWMSRRRRRLGRLYYIIFKYKVQRFLQEKEITSPLDLEIQVLSFMVVVLQRFFSS